LKLSNALLLLLAKLAVLLLLLLSLHLRQLLLFGLGAEDVAGRDEELKRAAGSGRTLLKTEAEGSRFHPLSLLLLQAQLLSASVGCHAALPVLAGNCCLEGLRWRRRTLQRLGLPLSSLLA
jgi:hypothetical protein